jgi:predicted DsbA family dithiol-disulfide isomerase
MTTPSLTLTEVDAPDPRRTASGAVVLDWWCDLACRDCAESVELLEEVRDRFGDDVEVRLRHFPLTNHVWAVAAAQCQLEAEAQGQGRAYTAHALATREEMEGPADYVDLLAHLGLDEEEGALALFDGRHASAVRADHDAGRALGVTGTPTFVVDGLLVGAGSTLDGALDAVVSRVSSALGRA